MTIDRIAQPDGAVAGQQLERFPVLASLVAQAQADITSFNAACTLTDSIVAEAEGRDITDADWAVWERANRARKSSLAALLDHGPGSVAELAAKAEVICSALIATEVDDADWPRVYRADALHLAASAGGAQ